MLKEVVIVVIDSSPNKTVTFASGGNVAAMEGEKMKNRNFGSAVRTFVCLPGSDWRFRKRSNQIPFN
ncbi:hypothetical protein LTR39_003625, partial [Cryomyces antarcticus]